MLGSEDRRIIYLNHATTSFPKPESVISRVHESLIAPPGDPRRGHCSGVDILVECRERLTTLIHARDASRVILTSGATLALNLAISGTAERFTGSANVMTTVYEHNSVLRPLERLRSSGRISVTTLGRFESLAVDGFRERVAPDTRAVVVTACSNVTGDMPDLVGISRFCEERGLFLIVDSSQAAGSIAIDVRDLGPRSLIAFAGHKGLMGPRGVGALYVGEGVCFDELAPLIHGGTGTMSESLSMPDEWPTRYEPGTMNVPGFAGFAAALDFVSSTGVARIGDHKAMLTRMLVDRLAGMRGVTVAHRVGGDEPGGVVSVHFDRSSIHGHLGQLLSREYGVVTRSGLHCAPLIHRELGWPDGSLRFSIGFSTTASDICEACDALEDAIPRQTQICASCKERACLRTVSTDDGPLGARELASTAI